MSKFIRNKSQKRNNAFLNLCNGYSALSRSAYSRMQEDCELPSMTTLARLTSKVKTLHDMSYTQNVFHQFNYWWSFCEANFAVPCGIVFVRAVNKPRKLANTVLSFILICLSSAPNSYVECFQRVGCNVLI